MVQKLLTDRFKLTFHHDKKELSVYVLTVRKGGPKNVTKSESPAPGFSIPIRPAPGGIAMSVRNGTMTNFAFFGQQGAVLDRPVLDQTGLTDRFDFTVTWAPDESQFGGRIPPPSERTNPPPGPVHCHSGAAWVEAGRSEGAGRRDGDRSCGEAFGELAAIELPQNSFSATLASRILTCRNTIFQAMAPIRQAPGESKVPGAV